LKIIGFNRSSFPKIAVLATGLAAAFLIATINPAPSAQAYPGRDMGFGCTTCHGGLGGSVTAIPDTLTPAADTPFTVTITVGSTGGASTDESGFDMYLNGVEITTGDPQIGATFAPVITAPAAAGTYVYTVNAEQGPYLTGQGSTTTFTITVPPTSTTTTTTPAPTTTTPAPTTTTPVPTTTTPAPTPIKYTTSSYIASTRIRTAVYVHTLVHQYSPSTGVISGAGRVSYLQRYNMVTRAWQNLLARTGSSAGAWTVGFIQPKVYQYRIVTLATSNAGGASSGSTFR